MFDVLNVVRALSDENRLRILMALRRRDMCVCRITAFLDLAPSTTSKHLSILRQSRLIESRKKGRWVYYRLAGNSAPEPVRAALEWATSCLEHCPAIVEDAARMEDILRLEAACGLNPADGDNEGFHSPELHILDRRMSVCDETHTSEHIDIER